MSDNILEIVGETEEFADFTNVPDSHYPVELRVGEINIHTNQEGGESPYVDLSGLVTAGPFKGETISSRYWLSFGKPSSSGGVLPLLFSTCRTNSGQPVDLAPLYEGGYVDIDRAPGEDNKEHGARTRASIKDFYNTLDGAEKLNLVARMLRVAAWDGKNVIAHVNLEESIKTPGRFFNGWSGFYAVAHAEKGMAFVNKISFPEQQEAIGNGTSAQGSR